MLLHLPVREVLFWGGIFMMGLSAGLSVICAVIFCLTGKGLKKKLEKEYGKLQR